MAGLPVSLPIMPINEHFAIALLMVTDMGVRFGSHAGTALAARLAPLQPDIVVGCATLGIPVAIEITRALGLDHYVTIQKSKKFFLGDALTETVTSLTSQGKQTIRLDRRAIPALAGKRVVLADDVIATGASITAALRLLRQAGAHVVGIATILTETHAWREALGADAALVHRLGHIPQFTNRHGAWEPIAGTI